MKTRATDIDSRLDEVPSTLGITSGWFAGPKAENAPWFSQWISRILDDYYAWRRNYFPEDGVVVDSAQRRTSEPFADAFEDRMLELLAKLKADVPFHSPRYAAHMISEQTLPAIAGYFAGMLYNPNNVTSEAAPVTARLEMEVGRMLSQMVGHGPSSWGHLCSGGTLANFEALWIARSVRYLPLVVADVRRELGLNSDPRTLGDAWKKASPDASLGTLAYLWRDLAARSDARDAMKRARAAMSGSPFSVADRGIAAVLGKLGSQPALLVPESHHYCFEKALDLLGLGRTALVSVPVDEDFRQSTPDLEAALDRCEAEGRHILAVVGVVGTTEEGAVDPIEEIVALRAKREAQGRASFWLHADGAYGGYLRTVTIPERIGLGPSTTRVRIGESMHDLAIQLPDHEECEALASLGSCDSVTIDPHKLGYVPYPAGAVLFKNDLVKPVARQYAPYLDDGPGDIERERQSDAVGLFALEGSKPGATAAAVWLSHTLIPLDTSGHGRLIREGIRGACELHALLCEYPALAGNRNGRLPRMRAEPLCVPGSNIVCYAFVPAAEGATATRGLADINALNSRIYERFSVQSGKRVQEQSYFVSRTSLSIQRYGMQAVGLFLERLGVSERDYAEHGVFLLRSVIMNPWLELAKGRGRYYLSELVAELFRVAEQIHDER